MPKVSGSKMMQQDAKRGMHRMPDGHMMKDSEMRKKTKKGKKSKYAGMMYA